MSRYQLATLVKHLRPVIACGQFMYAGRARTGAPFDGVRGFTAANGQADPTVLHAEATDLVPVVVARLHADVQRVWRSGEQGAAGQRYGGQEAQEAWPTVAGRRSARSHYSADAWRGAEKVPWWKMVWDGAS